MVRVASQLSIQNRIQRQGFDLDGVDRESLVRRATSMLAELETLDGEVSDDAAKRREQIRLELRALSAPLWVTKPPD
jgi:hypothetical protein